MALQHIVAFNHLGEYTGVFPQPTLEVLLNKDRNTLEMEVACSSMLSAIQSASNICMWEKLVHRE